MRYELERAQAAELNAAWQLAKTAPSTPAGAGAFLSYIAIEMFSAGEMDWHPTAIDTIVKALGAMETAPPHNCVAERWRRSGLRGLDGRLQPLSTEAEPAGHIAGGFFLARLPIPLYCSDYFFRESVTWRQVL
jgi:hypothetical protein